MQKFRLQRFVKPQTLKEMKKLVFSILAFALMIIMAGCTTSKQIAYFQNIDTISLAASRGLYDARIMPKDELSIYVQTTDPTASTPFNLQGSASSSASTSGSRQGYLVDNTGNINFPVIGKIHVAGLTKGQCEELIKSKIQPYLARTETPIVIVRMSSYRIVVMGAVNHPGVIPVTTEKISIMEALAQAGDLNIKGRRDNVMLIREEPNGEKHETRLDLNDANLINSPYYYLQQNDMIYVEPNTVMKRDSELGSSTSIWFSLVSVVTSLASLVLNILR